MLSSTKLSMSFWAEALSMAYYLVNRSLSYNLKCYVPQHVWSGRKINYSHLRVFGYKAFMYVLKEQRTKLDSKANECIFLGYGDDKLSYRLCDPKKRKLIRDRDIMFREDQTFGGFEKEEIPQEYVPRSIEERDEMHTSMMNFLWWC